MLIHQESIITAAPDIIYAEDTDGDGKVSRAEFLKVAPKSDFDKIDTIDILDVNAGSHGKAFATNFNPEINLRETAAHGAQVERIDGLIGDCGAGGR